MSPVRRSDRGRGFAIEVEGLGEFNCGDVRGFREASVAAVDPRAAAPQRLVIVAPEPELLAWLEAWAEDTEQIRRTLTICRRFDARAIDTVATIGSFGYGVETSLTIESVTAGRSDGGFAPATTAAAPAVAAAAAAAAKPPHRAILRSGVHLKVDGEAVLARYDAEAQAELGFADFD
jgi:hypothetical protein